MSFVRFLQEFSDKTAMTLKSIALVVYPKKFMQPNSSRMYPQLLPENGLTPVGFWQAKTETCERSDLNCGYRGWVAHC